MLYALDTTLLDPWPKHNTGMDFAKHVDMDFATHTCQELNVENGGQVDRWTGENDTKTPRAHDCTNGGTGEGKKPSTHGCTG